MSTLRTHIIIVIIFIINIIIIININVIIKLWFFPRKCAQYAVSEFRIISQYFLFILSKVFDIVQLTIATKCFVF